MEDFNRENHTEGEISGFDSAENINGEKTQNPLDGFYTKKAEDIIQDDFSVFNTEPQPKEEPKPEYTYQPPVNNYGYTNPYVYQKPQKPKREKRYGLGVVLTAVLLAAVIGAVSGAIASTVFSKEEPSVIIDDNNNSSPNVNINIDETAETIVEAVAEKVTPSVIGIRTTTSVMSFFGGMSDATGEGSGVVYTADGYIITNYHVISDAVTNRANTKVEVFLDNAESKPYDAKVVGYNISADLAVIKIDAKNLIPVDIANSDNLKVGQYVITIGNPGGLEFMDSVTYGIVSGLDRVVSADSGIELIQTDAAINPGNSGGALVNAKGELVGINSSKIVSEEYEGMGFAIPSNTTIEIVKNIISKENSPEPYIGITISETYTAEVLEQYGFPAGAVVLSVVNGGPAYEAGIRKGDIITECNGTKISDYNVLEDIFEKCKPDESLKIKLYRSGRTYQTTIKVGSNNQVG